MENNIFSKYGDFTDIDNIDAEELKEDILTFIFQLDLKERKLSEEIQGFKTTKAVNMIVEYLSKRKELAEEYIKKIKSIEKEK